MKRILFLDLDGTVRYSNHESGFINKPEHIEVYPEAKREIKRFMDAGWEIAFVTNQGGIACGFTTFTDFTDGVVRTNELLGIDPPHLEYCPHYPKAGCICRKPLPGMVVRAIDAITLNHGIHEADVRECLFVGDRPEDQGCAKACGIPFMLAETWREGGFTAMIQSP